MLYGVAILMCLGVLLFYMIQCEYFVEERVKKEGEICKQLHSDFPSWERYTFMVVFGIFIIVSVF